MLPGGTRIDYVIDPQGRRIGKKKNGALQYGLLYQDALNPIAELGPDGRIKSVFLYAEHTHAPAAMVRDGKLYRFVTDHLGSIRVVIDTTTGTIAQQLDYDVWGKVTLDTQPGFQPFGFAGGVYDPDTGLTRFGARDYDGETGRWTAKDPILFAGGDTNLYGYVEGDPVSFIDPLGEGKFGVAIRVGKWGLAKLGNLTRDAAKREFRKNGKDVHGSSNQLKKWAKAKGKGKPIKEKHGDGTEHWHRPDRKGGHGFLNSMIPGACLGYQIFGDNVFGDVANFFNPLSDLQDVLDLVASDDGYED